MVNNTEFFMVFSPYNLFALLFLRPILPFRGSKASEQMLEVFSVKGQTITILDFACPPVLVVATQLFEVATDNTKHRSLRLCFNKAFLKQVARCI